MKTVGNWATMTGPSPEQAEWVRSSRSQLRARITDLTVAMRLWQNPPAHAWILVQQALWIIVLAGAKNSGVPANRGRDAVEVVYHVAEGRMELDQGLKMLEEME